MSKIQLGLIYCLSFVALEAFQAVYLGTVFQEADSFLVGSLVFGITVLGCTTVTAIFRPAELWSAIRAWRILLAVNILAALAWTLYFVAIQLTEPAVVFTVFSGMVPLGTVLAGWLGIAEAFSTRSRFERAGHGLILLSILVLAAITAFGYSGFVRGDWLTGLVGAVLSALSGGLTALVIVYSVRLNKKGIKPLAQFGLRFILYTLVAIGAYLLELDAKATSLPPAELARIVLIGLAVIAFPLYLVQKAVPLLHPSVIAAIAALGPIMVFIMQLIEGRVDYSTATLAGLSIYLVGALLAVYGTTASNRSPRAAR